MEINLNKLAKFVLYDFLFCLEGSKTKPIFTPFIENYISIEIMLPHLAVF